MRRVLASLGVLVALACQSAPSPGASCTHGSDCADPLVCRFGRCRAECTTNRDCGASQSCIVSSDHQGVCQLDVDLGCEGGVGRECPSGLVCANDRCINPCTTDAECPSDGACRLSPMLGLRVCVDPGRVTADAGPFPDGGVPPAPPCGTLTDLCSGDEFVCAIRDGSVFCWGDDSSSQHGDLAASDFHPTRVLGPSSVPVTDAVELACGALHACARTTGGDVICWGDNASDQLGSPNVTTGGDQAGFVHFATSDPEWVGSARFGATRLDAGNGTTCALRENGHWVCWGNDVDGEIPSSSAMGTTVATATYFPDLDGATSVAFGATHGCDATSTSVRCRGARVDALGDPAVLATTAGVTELALGNTHSCAVVSGSVRCWGSDVLGQLGDGPSTPTDACTSPPCSATPLVAVAAGAVRVATGSDSDTICAVTGNGQLACWGENTLGEVDASGTNADAPVTRTDLPGAVCDVAVGRTHVCATSTVAGVDHVHCWGSNGNGQLGILPDGAAHPGAIEITLPP